MHQRFFYCPKCGGSLNYRLLDAFKRLVCEQCGYIFYENPVVGVAAIVLSEKRILLGKRAQGATYSGQWCIPCGYVEYNEDVYQAVVRECLEETGLKIGVTGVFTVQSNFHNPEMHTVGIWFTTKVLGGELKAGDDLEEVAFFSLSKLPSLAFPTDYTVLKLLEQEKDISI